MATLIRDAGINSLCPPRRANDDRLYAEWVLNVATTLPDRSTCITTSDENGWDAWKAEAHNVAAWLAS